MAIIAPTRDELRSFLNSHKLVVWAENLTSTASRISGTYPVGSLLVGGEDGVDSIPDVATGNVLLSGGVDTSPSYGKVGLESHVTGTLGVDNGGTGLVDVPIGRILFGNDTSPLDTAAGFTFNGTTLSVPGIRPSETGGITGTESANNVNAGGVGEHIVATASAVNFPTTTEWGDLGSISLTPGDWDVDCLVVATDNGATVTMWSIGISATAGNFSTGLVLGDNYASGLPPVATSDSSLSISSYRVSISTTTTIYLKCNAAFSVAVPQASGRISARRRR